MELQFTHSRLPIRLTRTQIPPERPSSPSSRSLARAYLSPGKMASSSSNVVGVHYRVGKKIGEGSFGVIFEGTNLLNNQQVAIKFVCCTFKDAVAEKKKRMWEKKGSKLRRKKNTYSPFRLNRNP